jgi:hypothetical protein
LQSVKTGKAAIYYLIVEKNRQEAHTFHSRSLIVLLSEVIGLLSDEYKAPLNKQRTNKAHFINVAVAQLVKALRYKPWHYGPEVDSASNRNEYQEYFMGVKAAGA